MLRASGQDQPGRHAPLIFTHALGHAGQLLRGGVAVAVGRIAQNDDGVKAGERGVRGGRKPPCDGSAAQQKQNGQSASQPGAAPPP